MEFAIWAYPWDILDQGPETVIDRLTGAGIDEINLATTYHTVHSYAPTNPDRRSYFARASAYFQPTGEYDELEPVPAEAMGDRDWTGEIADAVADSPLSLNAWAVGCHNSRLGLEQPEATLTTPHGDSLPFGLCPSQPAVQSYLTALAGELDDRGSFERLELETFDYFFGSGLGWHHDKVFVDLGRLGTFLNGVCFCERCQSTARDAGVDVDAARDACREAIDAIAAGQLPSTLDPLRWIQARPAVEAYLEVREQTLLGLFADLRRRVDADLGYYVGLLDVGEEWLFGADLPRLSQHLDYVTAIAYESTPAAVTDRVLTADALSGDVPVHTGLQPGPPVLDSRDGVASVVDAAVEAGTERISFYNYGPLPRRSFEWIEAATDQYA